MECIRGQNKAQCQETFRVKTKLNSEEAGRRFNKIRQGLVLPSERLTELCREGVDQKLAEELAATGVELCLSVELLSQHCVGEKEYLGTAVLTLEGILSKTKDLLLRADLARQTGQRLPHGFQCRAQTLATQLGEGRQMLVRMHDTIEKECGREVAIDVAASVRGTGWTHLSWRSRNSKGLAEEHHEREHLFTGLGWRQPQRCRCLDYR